MKDITEQLMFKAPRGHVLHGCARPARWLRWSHLGRARWLVEAGYARDLLDAVGVLEGCGEWPVECLMSRSRRVLSRGRGLRRVPGPARSAVDAPGKNLNPNHKPEDYWWNK